MASFRGVHGGLVKRGQTKRPVGIDESHDVGRARVLNQPYSSSYDLITTLTASTLLDPGLNSSTNGCNGYFTGNAKYLHVWISGAAGAAEQNAGVVVHGFNYDIGEWGKLEIPAGHNGPVRNDGRSKALNLQSDGFTPAAVRIGPGGGAVMRTLEINGLDRVGFVLTGSSTPNRFAVRASVSTI
jgi:hypothetical protein